jgi:GT2 family glycosyltransferase
MTLTEKEASAFPVFSALTSVKRKPSLLQAKPKRNPQKKKVLFYTLPLVLRERPTLFSSIVDVYLPLAQQFAADGWDCVFVGTDELRGEYPAFAHEWISPGALSRRYPDWMRSDWLQEWTGILTGCPPEFHQDFVNALILQAQPDLVFCWNIDSALEAVCSEQNISLIFNELGMLRPPNPLTYFSDPRGVNARSSFGSQFLHSNACSQAADLDRAVDRLKALEELYQPPENVAPTGCLILLQVRDDSNAITGSPFETMSEFVHCVMDVVAPSGITVIVKPHPLDEVPELPTNVKVADKTAQIEKLIGSVDVVFTLNSSAGFEAALAGKTVYVLGDAAYSGLGLTVDVADPATLATAWARHKNAHSASQALRARALNFAEQEYFLSSAQFNDPLFHFEKLETQDFIEDANSFRQYTMANRLKNMHQALQNELIRAKAACSAEKAVLKAQLDESARQLMCFERSNSWRMTRLLRALRRKTGALRTTVRDLYQRTPVLLILKMRVDRSLSLIKTTIASTFHSKNNAKALQALTERRFSYSMPTRTVDCVTPFIDVSIVTYNSAKWIDGFFSSLVLQDYPLNKLRLIFIDNGSDDDTVQQLHQRQAQLSHQLGDFQILQGPNVGFGSGHDRAIESGNADLILVTNVDIEFTSQTIAQLVASACEDINGEVASWEARQAPYEHPKYYDPVTLEVNWSSHACVLIRRSAYRHCGGYEPRIFMYGEDVELSYRLRSYGYRLKYCPSALVRHYTYEHKDQIKPVQFKGSTLANLYIRWRYGDMTDRIASAALQCLLLFRPSPYKQARLDILMNGCSFLRNRSHFSLGKGAQPDVHFPFRAFDYDMTRDGAFWPIGEPLSHFPKVTVVTRTYRGREEFLRQSIISVLNQTYPNIELVVVEDGGKTMDTLISTFALPAGKPIRYFGLEKAGRSVTGNYGLQMATGEYCVFLDDDDLLFSDHVEVLVTALQNAPQSVAAYSQALEVTTEIDEQGRYAEKSHVELNALKHAFDYNTLLDHNFIPIQCLLFKRSLYLNRGGFETDMSHLEDWNLWLRYGFNNTFAYVAKTTSLFRTPANLSIRKDRQMQLHNAYYTAKNRAIEACKHYA